MPCPSEPLEATEKMDKRIVSARELEQLGILKRRTALRMAQLGLLPHVRFGTKLKGVGFFQDEVIKALKSGVKHVAASNQLVG